MNGYLFLYIVITLVIQIILGCVTKSINEKKGYYGGFAWGFFLGVVGIIVVAVRQDNFHGGYGNNYSNNYGNNSYNQPYPISGGYNSTQMSGGETWKCGYCGRENASYFGTCACGTPKTQGTEVSRLSIAANQNTAQANSSLWKCRKCGTENGAIYRVCSSCGAARQQSDITRPMNNSAAPRISFAPVMNGWSCAFCGRYNESYVGTCACGAGRQQSNARRNEVNTYKKPVNEIQTQSVAEDSLKIAEALKKFKELLDMGVITSEEFEQKKNQLCYSQTSAEVSNLTSEKAEDKEVWECEKCHAKNDNSTKCCKNCGAIKQSSIF